jgi:Protein containing tetrapyrrole methyltransferase domain and MazG-like (predicted pyrophosphatase) domain
MSDAIRQALQLQHDAAGEGFDWPSVDGVWDKLAEEIAELRATVTDVERTEEFGDLLFVMVNLARHLGVDPEGALAAANRKFTSRYAFVMQQPQTLPPIGDPARLQAMEARWQRAKVRERGPDGAD